MQGKSTQKQKRSTRNRNRSKRRAILCPVHTCHLESRSPKYKLAASQIKQLPSQTESESCVPCVVLSSNNLVAISHAETQQGEWIESFWCAECKQQYWYHIREISPRSYQVELASQALCQQIAEPISILERPLN